MNTELLLRVRDAILAEPEHFQMHSYFASRSCGTAACIAGWASALSQHISVEQAHEKDCWPGNTAGDALELTSEQRVLLFNDSSWLCEHRELFQNAEAHNHRNDMARIAADRINHFIATDGKE